MVVLNFSMYRRTKKKFFFASYINMYYNIMYLYYNRDYNFIRFTCSPRFVYHIYVLGFKVDK